MTLEEHRKLHAVIQQQRASTRNVRMSYEEGDKLYVTRERLDGRDWRIMRKNEPVTNGVWY